MLNFRKSLCISSFTGFLVFLACLFLLLTACGRGKEVEKPAPASSMTKAQAVKFAVTWKEIDPDRHDWSFVSATGSMLPVIASNHILLLEKSDGKDLGRGDVALYEKRDKSGTICHRLTDIGPTGGLFFEGDNNSEPDGWVFPSRVRWRVAGQLFFAK